MATKPLQQDLNARDDKENDTQLISRDSALIPTLIHTVLTGSKPCRKEYKKSRQQMMDSQPEQPQIDSRINQQQQQHRDELTHLKQENAFFASLIKQQETDKDAAQKQVNSLINQLQSLKFINQVRPQPFNQPKPHTANNQLQ